MSYRIEVLKNLCISAGKCVSDGPKVFRFDADELAEPIHEQSDVELLALKKLARNCPSEAILIYSEQGELIDHLR